MNLKNRQYKNVNNLINKKYIKFVYIYMFSINIYDYQLLRMQNTEAVE